MAFLLPPHYDYYGRSLRFFISKAVRSIIAEAFPAIKDWKCTGVEERRAGRKTEGRHGGPLQFFKRLKDEWKESNGKKDYKEGREFVGGTGLKEGLQEGIGRQVGGETGSLEKSGTEGLERGI